MRNIVLFIIIILLNGCLAEQDNPLIIPTCTDGIRNQDEIDIDCGGTCEPCKPPLVVPCKATLTDNVFSLKNSKITLVESDYTASQTDDYFYRIDIFKNNITIRIILNINKLPTKSTAYNLVRAKDLNIGLATMEVSSFPYDYESTSGFLYFIKENGIMKVQICSVTLWDYNTSTQFSGSIILSK